MVPGFGYFCMNFTYFVAHFVKCVMFPPVSSAVTPVCHQDSADAKCCTFHKWCSKLTTCVLSWSSSFTLTIHNCYSCRMMTSEKCSTRLTRSRQAAATTSTVSLSMKTYRRPWKNCVTSLTGSSWSQAGCLQSGSTEMNASVWLQWDGCWLHCAWYFNLFRLRWCLQYYSWHWRQHSYFHLCDMQTYACILESSYAHTCRQESVLICFWYVLFYCY